MRLKNIPLVIILLILSYTNSNSQIWTKCTNGIYGGGYGVNYLGVADSFIFANPNSYSNYRSSDKGVNWFIANNGFPGIIGIVNYYLNGAELFACTSNGLYSSINHGQNWIPTGFNSAEVTCIIKSGSNLVLGGNSTYYSTNNGVNWINSSGTSHCRNFISVGNTLFVASGFYGIFASTNNGITWQPRNTGISNRIQEFAYFNGVLYAGGEGIYRTYDNGLNWNELANGFFHGGDNVYSLITHNGLLFAGTGVAVYKSSDGTSWVKSGIGTGYASISDLLSYDSVLFAACSPGGYKGLFATTNNGQNWYSSGFESYEVNSITTNNNTVFIGTNVRGVFSSSDYGDTWYPANVDMHNKNILSMIRHNSLLFAGTRDSGIYKSSNDGQNWVKSNSGLNNYSIKSLYTKDSILYCGTNSGAYKTTNSGENWNLIGLQNTPINTFYVFNNYYFAGTNNGIRISTDGGTSWASNLTGDSVISLYSFSEKLLAGTNHGVKVSTDFGNNWMSIGLANYRINSFTNMADTLVTSTNIGVFATTNMGNNWINLGPKQQTCGLVIFDNKIYTGGVNCVWRKDANILTGISTLLSEVPDKYILHQNYPNPFNPNTVISYQLPVISDVVIKVYDVQGREVRTLVNERMQAGTYEVRFDGTGMNSGVYFYQMTTGNYRETRRMILLK